MDSLLDTMTSVVGILIIILVVLQLGAKEAVQRIQSDPDSSPSIRDANEKLEEKEKELETLLNDRMRLNAEKQQLITRIGRVPSEALKQEKLKTIQSLQPQPSNSKLAKELEALKAENQKMMATSKNLAAQMEQMEKKMDTISKKPSAPMIRNLRLPDPKAPKSGSRGYRFICREGKVFPIDYALWDQRIKASLAKANLKKNSSGEVLDSKALAQYFQQSPIGDSVFSLKPVHNNNNKLLYFQFIPKKPAGDLPENLSKPQSHFQAMLKKVDPNKSHILFTVFPDSFDAYLAARKLLEAKGIPAGWSPSGPLPYAWQHHFNIATVGRSKLPKPKPSRQSPVSKAILD